MSDIIIEVITKTHRKHASLKHVPLKFLVEESVRHREPKNSKGELLNDKYPTTK